MAKIVIHTDGACSGNPGPGGWGAILVSGAHRKEIKGGEPMTTNNRMELTAAIHALECVEGTVGSRALYRFRLSSGRHHDVDQELEEEWLAHRRQETGAQCRAMAAAGSGRGTAQECSWHWVKAHNNDPDNDRADELAREGMAPFCARPLTA